MAGNEKKPTISDIARKAGVSIATVSRVLRGSDYPVKSEVRERVTVIARQMEYKPNIFSQMLRGSSSREIGIIAPSITNPFYAQLISAAEQECLKRGYIPFICSSMGEPQLEMNHLDMLEDRCVAGILLSSMGQGEGIVKRLNELRIPIMLFDQTLDSYEGDGILFDFYQGAYLSTEYLIQCGHRDIVFCSGPINRYSRRVMYEGYKQALKDYNLGISKKRLIGTIPEPDTYGEGEYQLGKALGQMLLERDYLPDAIVTINDITAIGVINYLYSEGIQVPHDISIMGFDDTSICEMVTPPLSTIHQPAFDTGKQAAKYLLDKIEGQITEPVHITMNPVLVERKSVRKIHRKVRR